MVSEIIGVGEALAMGGALAQNAQLAARELEAFGIGVQNQCAVGTDVSKLKFAVAEALSRSDVVVVLGGMGVGVDAITKKTICDGLSRRLVLHADSLDRIRKAYQHAGRQMPQQVKKLAMLPEKSIVFPGIRGITPGCALSAGRQFIILLPERPEEFLPMFQHSVIPYLAKFTQAALVAHTVNVTGMDPELVNEKLGDLLKSENPSVAVDVKPGELCVRVTARANSKQEASALCEPVLVKIQQKLGNCVYGVDAKNLQTAAASALMDRGLSVSAAESCTGGMLSELVNSVPGTYKILRYAVSAASSRVKEDALGVPAKFLKKYGSVSAQTAAAMAYGAMAQGNSDLGVAVTGSTGAKGEDQKRIGTVYIAVCDQQEVWVHKISLDKQTDPVLLRHTACMAAMNLMRKYAAALPERLPEGNQMKDAVNGKIANILENETAEGRNKGGKRPWYAAIFPIKGDDMKNIVQKSVLILSVLVFLASAGYLVSFYVQAESNKKMTAGLAEMYGESPSNDAIKQLKQTGGYPSDYQKKFMTLYAINSDVAGWIKIEDTQVNYPVVHYTDNDYYLRRDFYRKDNKHGIPWLEANNTLSPPSDNYVIYGHNMTDGQMFGELMKYKPSGEGLAYLKNHPIISFSDVYRDNEYQIISVFITNAKKAYGDIFYYNTMLNLQDENDFNTFVDGVRARSYYTSDIDVQKGDRFLTLSTCSYEFGAISDDADVRTVIVARRVRDGEIVDADSINYAYNPNPLLPPGFVEGQKQKAAAASKAAAESKASSQQAAVQESNQQAASTSSTAVAGVSEVVKQQPSYVDQTEQDDPNYQDEEEYQVDQEQSLKQKLQSTVDRLEKAQTNAENALERAKEYYSEVKSADTYDTADHYVQKVHEYADEAKQAYNTVCDLTDDLDELCDNSGLRSAQRAFENAIDVRTAVRMIWDDASYYAVDAQALVDVLKNAQPEQPGQQENEETESPEQKDNEETKPPEEKEVEETKPPVQKDDEATNPEDKEDEETVTPPKEEAEETEPPAKEEDALPPAPPVEDNIDDQEDDQTENTEVLSASVHRNDRITIISGGKKLTGSASAIVAKVVMNEMGTGFDEEAIKAQTVAAYTYIKFQNKTGVTPYLGTKTASSDIQNIVNSVIGKAVYYQNNYAFTPFYAMSAGVTIASKDVWGGSYPYLVSVDSEIEEQAKNYEQSVTWRKDDVADRVEDKLGIDLYDYSDDPEDWFKIKDYADGGRYVSKIRVGDRTTTGRILREQVLGLRSAAFDIDYSRGKFKFTTYGYGHGVGLSQIGANLYASEEDWDYIDILTHYFPGCKVR